MGICRLHSFKESFFALQNLAFYVTKIGPFFAENIATNVKREVMWGLVCGRAAFFGRGCLFGVLWQADFLRFLHGDFYASKVEILSKAEDTRPYSKYDWKIICHFRK